MRMISTRVHGFLDYVVAAFLIALPWLFDFHRGDAETLIPVAVGILSIVYSLLTNYELGIWRLLPMRLHLTLDILAGIFLIASPWLFGFASQVKLPHVAVGLLAIGVAMMSKRKMAFVTSSR